MSTGHYLVVAKDGEGLAVNKQISQRYYTQKFNVKKLTKVEGKENIALRSRIGLHLWKIWTLRWKIIMPGKRLERISTFQPKRE
jgi:hypothetical protein